VYIARPVAATRLSDHSWKWRNRDRDRRRRHCAAGINTEASDYAQFSVAIVRVGEAIRCLRDPLGGIRRFQLRARLGSP